MPSVSNHTQVERSSSLVTDRGALSASLASIVAGVALLAVGIWMLVGGTPLPLGIALLFGGAAEIATGVFAARGSRVGYAFGLSLNFTAFLVFFFGAPKVRDGLEVHMAVSVVPCLIFGAIALAYSLAGDEYKG